MSRAALEAAVSAAGLDASIAACHPLSGGCIHEVCLLELDDGTRVVAKLNRPGQAGVFEAEAALFIVLFEFVRVDQAVLNGHDSERLVRQPSCLGELDGIGECVL